MTSKDSQLRTAVLSFLLGLRSMGTGIAAIAVPLVISSAPVQKLVQTEFRFSGQTVGLRLLVFHHGREV